MKKVVLQKMIQHGNECYIGKIDPRKLVAIATKIEMGEIQDAQRPLNEKRVKEIAKYVSDENGILPSTLTIASKDDRIKIIKDNEIDDLYYFMMPETEAEMAKFLNCVDVMDGQHRLYSFLPDKRIISDTERYEIGFTIYDKPSLVQKRQIFISCNEKQEKVSSNLLLWFKQQLNMLTDDEKRYYTLVSTLNNEEPLKGHIIMSAEKIKNGVKAKEVSQDLKTAKIITLSSNGTPLTDDKLIKVIKTYLFAWQNVCGFDFTTSSTKEAGVAVKMAGLKYMIYILPAVWDYSIASHEKFNQEFVEKTLKRMISAWNVEYEKFFVDKELNKFFRDRTMIIEFSNKSTDIIKKLGAEDFDPLA